MCETRLHLLMGARSDTYRVMAGRSVGDETKYTPFLDEWVGPNLGWLD